MSEVAVFVIACFLRLVRWTFRAGMEMGHKNSYFAIHNNVAGMKKNNSVGKGGVQATQHYYNSGVVTTCNRMGQISTRKINTSNQRKLDEIFDEFEINIFCIEG